ncbi:unnamed protein product [Heligmosomoides polygyrus]|uniref:Uncharacterized protein n=1 Tax=Heligmosomoides polygyrus TaxID=6339 RepID=A0A3P8CCI7_HELPZ|nr:unnamed protein product [Heligmosomoides polygyrus]
MLMKNPRQLPTLLLLNLKPNPLQKRLTPPLNLLQLQPKKRRLPWNPRKLKATPQRLSTPLSSSPLPRLLPVSLLPIFMYKDE